jgi:hypothetical protein
MKKIVIPAILAAIVVIAGMFAMMPVEKASTVHTSINANSQTFFDYYCDEVVDAGAGGDDDAESFDQATGTCV